jgi:hypothetical protein
MQLLQITSTSSNIPMTVTPTLHMAHHLYMGHHLHMGHHLLMGNRRTQLEDKMAGRTLRPRPLHTPPRRPRTTTILSLSASNCVRVALPLAQQIRSYIYREVKVLKFKATTMTS